MATNPQAPKSRKQDRPKKVGRNSKARRRLDDEDAEDADRTPAIAATQPTQLQLESMGLFKLDMEKVQLQRELEEVRITCENNERVESSISFIALLIAGMHDGAAKYTSEAARTTDTARPRDGSQCAELN